MKVQREPGFYWIVFRNDLCNLEEDYIWEIAKFNSADDEPWTIIENDYHYKEEDLLKVGPRILSPQEKVEIKQIGKQFTNEVERLDRTKQSLATVSFKTDIEID